MGAEEPLEIEVHKSLLLLTILMVARINVRVR